MFDGCNRSLISCSCGVALAQDDLFREVRTELAGEILPKLVRAANTLLRLDR
jgi:hypothetical protein